MSWRIVVVLAFFNLPLAIGCLLDQRNFSNGSLILPTAELCLLTEIVNVTGTFSIHGSGSIITCSGLAHLSVLGFDFCLFDKRCI
jgi:hypothetical protein